MNLEWRNAPHSRSKILIVRPGDKPPADRATAEWWSAWSARVEWLERDRWEWLVFPAFFQGTGTAIEGGEASSEAEARRQAVLAVLRHLPDPTTAERVALAALAGIAAVRATGIQAAGRRDHP